MQPARRSIIHISHTDVRCDARILKEIEAVSVLDDVKVIAFGVDHDEGAAHSSVPSGVRIETIALRSRNWRWLHGAVRHAFNLIELFARLLPRLVASRPDVVHCHDTLVLPIGAVVKVLSGCALIYDAHELESEKNGQSRFLSRATLLMESMSWRQIDLLVSVSRPILDWYSQRFGTKPSILVMNSPAATPDCGFEKPTGRHFHLTFGIPEDKLVFLYLGILAPGRGIPGLLEAFSNPAVRSHLVFVGYRDMMGVKKASERVSNIHVHPPVPHGQVVQLSRSADCGLCLIEDISLSDRYCLPNKLFEYAFAGLPVLASRLPEIDRVVREFGLGMCCDNDAESIGAAVREIEQGAALPSQADLSELTWETQGERLRGAYVDLLSKRGRLQELNRMRGR